MDLLETFWDGTVQLSTDAHEMRMGHWVYAPKCVDISTGRSLFDLTGKHWDLMSVAVTDDSLDLRLRKYPGDRPEVVLQIWRDGLDVRLGGRRVACEDLEQRLDEARN